MATKLHELLAAEKTANEATNHMLGDTIMKFGKPDHFFLGVEASLSMLKDSPENKRLEEAARQSKVLPTNVYDTLDFMFKVWVRSEDLQMQKNMGNLSAKADIVFRGKTLASDVPVDELMGLEARLTHLRDAVLSKIPTVDASKRWDVDPQTNAHTFIAPVERVVKTEKIMVPVILYEATKEHPAQVKEATKDEVVGTFERTVRSGAATAVQKSEVLLAVDDLITSIKQARQRANAVEAPAVVIGQRIVDVLLEQLK